MQIIKHSQYETRIRSGFFGYSANRGGIEQVTEDILMLTFIRIRLPNLTLQSGTVDRMRSMSERKPTESEPEPELAHNPWHGELERLQRGLRSDTDQSRFGIHPGSRPIEPAPPPPPPLPKVNPVQQLRQGTLTDLKIWWGKATVYKTPEPSELTRFAPVPPKKSNRWLQF
jgi:hypothetical protein